MQTEATGAIATLFINGSIYKSDAASTKYSLNWVYRQIVYEGSNKFREFCKIYRKYLKYR